MYELFRNVLIMSGLGFCLTALLLALKPVTSRKFPAKWQYYIWVVVLVFMLIPVWRLIPQKQASEIIKAHQQTTVQTVPSETQDVPTVINDDMPIEYREIPIMGFDRSVRILDLISYIWLGGMSIFLLIVAASYVIYLCGKRKNTVSIADNTVLHKVKSELGIKRRIRVRMSSDIKSPLLCGALFPVIYIPCTDIPEEKLRMVFLHELTHYRRKDLVIKWLSVFVNAVHWFNPLAYMLTANISEACEVSCDMEVTKDMSDAEQKLYMATILDLV